MEQVVTMFPRPQCRGPIEAYGVSMDWTSLCGRFHGLSAVAPLKQKVKPRGEGVGPLVSTASVPWPH